MSDVKVELDARNLEVGQKYVVMITGVIRSVVTECVLKNHPRYGTAVLKVLNQGFMHNTELKGEDYILQEVYDAAKHGVVVGYNDKPKRRRWWSFFSWS